MGDSEEQGKCVFVLAAIQESRLPNGERAISESEHSVLIEDKDVAIACLKKLRTALSRKGQVSPVMDDAFTILYKSNEKAITWTVKSKKVINSVDEFQF